MRIANSILNCSEIVIEPVVNIPKQLYAKLYTALLSTSPCLKNVIYVRVSRSAFIDLKSSIKVCRRIQITIFHGRQILS